MCYKIKLVGLLSSAVVGFLFLGCPVFAITYQDDTDVQFTFNSTLSISISDADIVIGNLIPGQDDTSNTVDVVVNTNNLYGYTLTATVGDTTNDYRDLRHTNGTTNIASIDVNSDLSTLSNQSSSVWGYTVSTNGTTWSNYNGLPKYDDTSNTAELRATDGAAADSTTSFKIGAYAEEGQLAGDYTNVINFKVVTNGAPVNTIATAITLQDVSSKTDGGCPAELLTGTVYQLTDSRDGEVYNVAKLADGNCWMLDNLALDLSDSAVQSTLTSSNTNASDISLNYLKNGGGSASDQYATAGIGDLISGNSYSVPLINADYKTDAINLSFGQSGTGRIGVYYNYCAASAGSYCYGEDASFGDAAEDICPKGWRMPTGGNSGEYQFFNGYVATLRLAFFGYFYDGLVNDQGSDGSFWSSTRNDNDSMYYLNISTPSYFSPLGINYRVAGQSVRCLLK